MKRGKSQDNQLGNLRPLIVAMMEDEGRITDNTICEICLTLISDNRYDIHHTRYDGATYQDLQVVCRKCNTAQENRFLD